MLDLVVWERGAAPLGHGAVSRVATMPHSLQNAGASHGAVASRRFAAGRQLTPFLLVSLSAAHCVFSLDLLGLVEGLVGIPLRLLRVPTKKFARRLRSLGRLSKPTAARAVPRFRTGLAVAMSQKAGLARHPEQRLSHALDAVRPPLRAPLS